MFTVIVGFDWSGKSRKRKPFDSSLYSVMPSTLATFVTPLGSGGCACAPMATNRKSEARNRR